MLRIVHPTKRLLRSLPFNTDAPVRDNTSGPNSPDLEIIWMPLLVLEGGTKRPPKGVTGVSMVC